MEIASKAYGSHCRHFHTLHLFQFVAVYKFLAVNTDIGFYFIFNT